MTHAAALAVENLPADPEALRSLVLALASERDAAIAECQALAVRNERLHALLLKLADSGDHERSIRSIMNTESGDHEHLLAWA